MEYKISKSTLSSEQQIYLANFEDKLKQFVSERLKESEDPLGITPIWSIESRKNDFLNIESDADFDKKGSLLLQSEIVSFVLNKLAVDFPECSLHLFVKYRIVPEQKENKDITKEITLSDELPTFYPQTPRYSFDQIILPEETITRIHNDLNVIKHQNLIYNIWGFNEVDTKPKSILNFYGPPGTGKTMCAHAIAKVLEKPLLALNYSEIESKYVGDAAKNLKKAFDTATEINAVMFFDEADSFLGKRIENVSHGSDQALNSLRSQMLILLEEFEGVVLFASNLVTNFDKAFESRILDHVKFELPNKEARASIIDKMLPSKLPMEHRPTQTELLEASELIEGFSGREIKGAVLTMLLDKAGTDIEPKIFSYEDLKSSLIKKKEQIEKLKSEEKERRKEKIIKRLEDKIEEDNAYEQHRYKKKRKKKIKTDVHDETRINEPSRMVNGNRRLHTHNN